MSKHPTLQTQFIIFVLFGDVVIPRGGQIWASSLLSLLKVVQRKSYPFGPFMFVGAVVGVVWGETVARAYMPG